MLKGPMLLRAAALLAAASTAALASAGDQEAANARFISVEGTPAEIALWDQPGHDGRVVPHYSITLDGQNWSRIRETDYTINLRYAGFDPLVDGEPAVPPALMAPAESRLHLVQFVVPPLEPMQQQVEALGGEIVRFMANHTHIVRMDAAVAEQVRALPYVRWVGVFHTAYKLDGLILEDVAVGASLAAEHYSVEVFIRGGAEHAIVAGAVRAFGGSVLGTTPESFQLDLMLTSEQLLQVARMDEVHFMDPRGELELDMDIVREIGGANFIETVEGFTGQGVRAEAADSGCMQTHVEFQGPNGPPLIHGPPVGNGSHGTAVYGVLFASGVNAAARGMLPDAEQGIFAEASYLRGVGNIPNRFQHTAQLVDPNGPYRAVFQTNSTGDNRTTQYTTLSAAMDDLLFAHDILHCQSMSNASGTPDVRPQAWAKNIVGVGGITHRNTISRTDDIASGSSGPAADGRIKPDLSHFYDQVFTTYTTSSTGYSQFSGTSSATPITAGHFGIFFQMWHEGVWAGRGGGATVFDSRPHMSTAKAMMINTAHKYPLNQGDLRRIRQGWGMADLRNLYNNADKTFIVNEEDVLTPLGANSYMLTVPPGETELAVTMVYTDLMGPTSATQHRINDLSLRVISPGGASYWGNNGLMTAHFNSPGGVSNTKDTVENVFVQNPQAGVWTIEVHGDEIIQDAHVETPALDADYALVVRGVELDQCDPCDANCDGVVDAFDIEPFIATLGGSAPCAACTGDTNGDGVVDAFDIEPFINCLTGP